MYGESLSLSLFAEIAKKVLNGVFKGLGIIAIPTEIN
jgi:hypothetical protein